MVKYHEWQYTMSVCPSVHLSGNLWEFYDFIFVLISSVGVQRRDTFIPTLGSEGPQWGPDKLICPYLSLFLYLSVRSSAAMFGDNFPGLKLRAAHAAAGHGFKCPVWQHNMSVRLSVCPPLHTSIRLSVCLSVQGRH